MDDTSAAPAVLTSSPHLDVDLTSSHGSRIRCRLVADSALSLEDMHAWLASPAAGAIATFVGTTRNVNHGRAVLQLEYEAAAPLALKVMRTIALDACAHAHAAGGPLSAVYVAHRVGVVPVSHASVLVGASSPHRREALAAVARVIDDVKARLPVWKKEYYEDGGVEWRENCECSWSHAPVSASAV